MQIHQVKRNTENRDKRYVGRGGKRGKTSGRGTKGQNSRAGRKIRPVIRDMIKKIRIIWEDKSLRNRILFVLGALIIFRVLAAIPIPGIDPVKLSQFLSNNQFFGILNIFSGGGLSNLSIIMLGVGPYIT